MVHVFNRTTAWIAVVLLVTSAIIVATTVSLPTGTLPGLGADAFGTDVHDGGVPDDIYVNAFDAVSLDGSDAFPADTLNGLTDISEAAVLGTVEAVAFEAPSSEDDPVGYVGTAIVTIAVEERMFGASGAERVTMRQFVFGDDARASFAKQAVGTRAVFYLISKETQHQLATGQDPSPVDLRAWGGALLPLNSSSVFVDVGGVLDAPREAVRDEVAKDGTRFEAFLSAARGAAAKRTPRAPSVLDVGA